MKPVAPPRIGSSWLYVVLAVAGLGLGFLLLVAGSSPQSRDALPLAFVFLLLGAGFGMVAFWKGLFGAIERRLIDLQTDMRQAAPEAPAEKGPPEIY